MKKSTLFCFKVAKNIHFWKALFLIMTFFGTFQSVWKSDVWMEVSLFNRSSHNERLIKWHYNFWSFNFKDTGWHLSSYFCFWQRMNLFFQWSVSQDDVHMAWCQDGFQTPWRSGSNLLHFFFKLPLRQIQSNVQSSRTPDEEV